MPIPEEVSSEDETYSPQLKHELEWEEMIMMIMMMWISSDQMGKLMLEHLLHPCTLPFSVQNKLLFFLSQDDINALFHDRNKTKDG